MYHWNTVSSLLYSILFILITINEFNYMGYYMNDSELGCIYMYLSGLHYMHVLYGTITLGASSNSIHSLGLPPIYNTPIDMYYTMDYYYWHMVEVVYIHIIILLYYYYIILTSYH